YEVFETYRRIMLTSGLRVFDGGSGMQYAVGLLVCAFGLRTVSVKKPYLTNGTNRLTEIISWQLMLTFAGALVVGIESDGGGGVNSGVDAFMVAVQQQPPAPALEDARAGGGKLLSGTSIDPEAQRGLNVTEGGGGAPSEAATSADAASVEAEIALAEASLSAAHASASAFLEAASAEGVKKKAMKISWRAYTKAKAEEEELQAEIDRLKARLPARPTA
ncbi:hypothetical protein TeGR_g764, partial [Tetraparma gracilis]